MTYLNTTLIDKIKDKQVKYLEFESKSSQSVFWNSS